MKSVRKRYVGLDIHKDVVEYCILDAAGGLKCCRQRRVDGGRIICERSVLERFATTTLSANDHVALEATTNTWAVVDILEPHVARIVVGNPLKTKAIAEAKVKTDKVDAKILAQLLRCDFLPGVWIPDAKTRVLRRLSSFRKSLVREMIATKNRIKNVFNHHLIKHEVAWTKAGLDELKRIKLPSHERIILECETTLLQNLWTQIAKIEKEIKRLAYEEENVRILMTLPGVDYNTATAVLAAFGDITRFKDADHAASYLGLVPSTKQSANSCHHGPITKTGSGLARSCLCEAAQHLSRNDGPLGIFVRRIMQKKGWNKAVVAGARKLATIVFHMLKNREPYRYAGIDRTRVKLRRIRMAASGKRVYMPRYDNPAEAPGDDVLIRHVPPLSDVYEKEGLPPAKRIDELSDGEKRVLQESGLLDRFRERETVQTMYTPKTSSGSSR